MHTIVQNVWNYPDTLVAMNVWNLPMMVEELIVEYDQTKYPMIHKHLRRYQCQSVDHSDVLNIFEPKQFQIDSDKTTCRESKWFCITFSE